MNRPLKKLGKLELLEIMEEQEREIKNLKMQLAEIKANQEKTVKSLTAELAQEKSEHEKETESLKLQLAEAKEKIKRGIFVFENAGVLTEAVLQINGVMEAAEKAADQYIRNLAKELNNPAKSREVDGAFTEDETEALSESGAEDE